MTAFDVEMVGDGPEGVQDRLTSIANAADARANAALRETAQEVKEDLEDTSPVDTGEYQSSWYIYEVAQDEVWILNEADHAKYVMLPNSRMVGSSSADLPGQGVLHNVKGVARKHSDAHRENMLEQLRDMFSNFRSRSN